MPKLAWSDTKRLPRASSWVALRARMATWGCGCKEGLTGCRVGEEVGWTREAAAQNLHIDGGTVADGNLGLWVQAGEGEEREGG